MKSEKRETKETKKRKAKNGKNFKLRRCAKFVWCLEFGHWLLEFIMYPTYLDLSETSEFSNRVEKTWQMLEKCELCGRKCRVNRLRDEKGICRSGKDILISSFNAHFGEEPPLSGFYGSGTIFLTNCNLHCVYCQNYPISQLENGNKYTFEEVAQMMISLQNRGCHNINFVTPTHFVPQILKSLEIAIKNGLQIPIVYNTGGYDSIETLRLLDGIVEIYLPDARYGDSKIAEKYSGCKNYVEINRSALKEMHRQVGDLICDQRGIARKGLIIRHLVLPGGLSGTREVMHFIAEEISPKTYISLMEQYFPAYRAYEFPLISRRINDEEYEEAKRIMRETGLEEGWWQER
ncbi:MAG: radical SAM protein [Candidatus Edwardsbacteria bacterium]